MASTDSVVCSVDEHGACFTFPDSSREYVQHTVLQHSSVLRSMLRSLLSEGDEQKQLTLVAPRGFLCNWIDLSKLLSREILAHPESLRSVPSDAIVHFLQVSPCSGPVDLLAACYLCRKQTRARRHTLASWCSLSRREQ